MTEKKIGVRGEIAEKGKMICGNFITRYLDWKKIWCLEGADRTKNKKQNKFIP